jgi:hypothetical protein
VADDGMTERPIHAIVQGIWTFILDYIALLNPLREPRTVPIFELGLVNHAPPGAPFPKATLTSDERSRDGRAAAIGFVMTARQHAPMTRLENNCRYSFATTMSIKL